LIIPMIIQTIGLDPSGAVWTDEAPHVSRLDPSGADQIDAEHPTHNRKVEGSDPSSGSKPQVRRCFWRYWLSSGGRRSLLWSVIVSAPFAVLVCRPHPA
jgi:hypothetical protein